VRTECRASHQFHEYMPSDVELSGGMIKGLIKSDPIGCHILGGGLSHNSEVVS